MTHIGTSSQTYKWTNEPSGPTVCGLSLWGTAARRACHLEPLCPTRGLGTAYGTLVVSCRAHMHAAPHGRVFSWLRWRSRVATSREVRANVPRGYSRYVVDWWEITGPQTRRLKRGHETQIYKGSGRQDSVIPYVLFKGVYMALCLCVLVSGIGTRPFFI
jgi:hypothetical protein